uniref:Odorant-binding protein 14 n=1 Tax=Cyrtorhinus lividipennis TaxID=1032904 RepID=A0A346THZ6_9HEMI|nr:odorant-binding protein 14 [Cyrtorhinus lividipennis]
MRPANMEAVFWAVALSVFGRALSAPTSQVSGCMALTPKDTDSVGTCCNFAAPFSNETLAKCGNEAVSDPKVPKQYECLQDCLFTTDAVVGADKKLDAAAWKQLVNKNVEGDWKEIVANSVDHCEGFKTAIQGKTENECSTTQNDILFNCMSIQWYLNCPKSAWTSSESCNESRKKFETCLGPLFS